MMNNMQNLFSLYNQLRQNPAQLLAQRFNIPINMNMNDQDTPAPVSFDTRRML